MPGPHHHAAKSFTHVSGKLLRQLLLACWVLTGLVACGSATVGGGYNATTPTNIFEAQLFDQLESNVVVIASVNLGGRLVTT